MHQLTDAEFVDAQKSMAVADAECSIEQDVSARALDVYERLLRVQICGGGEEFFAFASFVERFTKKAQRLFADEPVFV